jgi:hypothetical protein
VIDRKIALRPADKRLGSGTNFMAAKRTDWIGFAARFAPLAMPPARQTSN